LSENIHFFILLVHKPVICECKLLIFCTSQASNLMLSDEPLQHSTSGLSLQLKLKT